MSEGAPAWPGGVQVARLLEAVGDRVFELDENLVVRGVHQPRIDEALLQGNQGLLGRWLPEMLPPKLAGLAEEIFGRARRTGEVEVVEYDLAFVGRPSERREARVARVEGGFVVVVRDVTRRGQAELRLRQSEALLRQMGELAAVGGWSYTSEGEVRWTEEINRIHGLAPGPPDVAGLLSRYTPEGRRELDEAIVRAMTDGTPFSLELKLVLPTGEERCVRVQGRYDRGQDGAPWRIWGATQDITARKAFEAQLVEAREAALVASEAKSRFLANASHEIRTPLSGVLGMTALALAGELSPEQRRHLEAAHASGVTLLQLLDALIDHARIEAGRLSLVSEPLAVGEVLAQAKAAVAALAQAKGLGLRVEVEAGLPPLLGDAVRLRQVVLNLLNNAVKFTERGGVVVRARWAHERLEVEVEDTGPGVPEELHEVIFEPFSQVDASSTRRFGGAGLGLSIARQLVERMGGRLGVRSHRGAGSIFGFSVPLTPVEAPPAPPLPSADLSGLPVHPLRTLVAEDNPINAAFLLALLGRLQHRVTVVTTGKAAVERAAAEVFDLILMDLQMPLMDGLEATRHIRAAERVEQRPVIVALTASAMPGEEQRCREAGMDAFLEKPLRFDRLAALLGRFFGVRAPVGAKPC